MNDSTDTNGKRGSAHPRSKAVRIDAPKADQLMATSAEQRRRLIHEYFGAGARIRAMRAAPVFGAPVFVVDFARGDRRHRTFGSFGPVYGEPFGTSTARHQHAVQITEQSSMDLLDPAQLVYHYERLMSVAFAQCERPRAALLLGVGGAAMWRFMRAYLPECTATLVDNDEGVVANARRWFHLDHPVVVDSAEHFLATTTTRFDVILVDLYNSHGPAAFDQAFWGRCFDALAPGGCIAINWADYSTNPRIRPMAEGQAEIANGRGLDCFYISRRNSRDNLVQYVTTARNHGPAEVVVALERFARERELPDYDRGILENCAISSRFPVNAPISSLRLASTAADLGLLPVG